MRVFIPIFLIALLIGCAAQPDTGTISDDQIGLSKVDVREIPDPPPVIDKNPDPGEGAPLPRAFEGAPALVSHSVADYLPITADENLCLDCHMIEGEAEEGLPTPIPESHYTDLRNAPTAVSETVAGARYNCSACHVAPTDAPPLVASRFGE